MLITMQYEPHVIAPLHHIVVITLHVNYPACEPHMRVPLHHIIVITMHVNCHT